MHIDTSLTGDRTGISCIAISGYKHQKKYSDTGEEYDMNELVYRQLFTIGIQAPKGDQISFQKTREFIYYLKKQLGWNIQMVSTDRVPISRPKTIINISRYTIKLYIIR